MNKNNNTNYKILAYHKYDKSLYTFYKFYDAGIVLQANEVLSVMKAKISLKGSYCHFFHTFKIFKMYIHNTGYDSRSLLLNKKEILYIRSKLSEGLILIPIYVYKYNNLIKLRLGLGKKNKIYESKKYKIKRSEDRKEAIKYNISKIQI